MLEYVIASYETKEPIFSLTIADPHSDAYLGSCGLNPHEVAGDVEAYYTILPEHQNKSLVTEAVKRVLEYLFEAAGLQRVVAYVVPENVPSVRVAEKLGFVDHGPNERQAQTAQILHKTLAGRRYVLES